MGAEGRLKRPVVKRSRPPMPVVRSLYPPKPPAVRSTYHQRVCQNLLPLSEATTLPEALKEWFFNEKVIDHEDTIEVCELCGKDRLRYHFQIENRRTQNMLWVGSKCILGFDIPVYDENGRLLDQRGAQRKLNDLMRKKRNESCVRALEQIAACDTGYRKSLYDALDYYRLHEYLTLKYARVVFWRLKKYKIDHTPEFFKLRLRRQKDKDTLRAMLLRDVHMLWPALSRGQRRLAIRLGHCTPSDLPTGGSRCY